jgi:ABC-type amino acid transport substrate-binding protein
LILSAGLALLGALTAVLPALARPLDEVKAAGVLRVTVYRDNAPFSWSEDGTARGIDVEIGAALARDLGVRVEYMELRADDRVDDDLRNGVWRGTVVGQAPGDVMLHVPYDHDLEVKNDLVKLVAPYHVEGLAMAVDPAKAEQAKSFALFETEKVSVDVGSLADFVLVSARDHGILNNVVHVRGTKGAFDAFERGEVSAVYGAAAAIEPLARKAKRPLAVIEPPTTVPDHWTVGAAVRINSRDLGYAIADSIEAMKTSGELKRIFESHGVTWRMPAVDN